MEDSGRGVVAGGELDGGGAASLGDGRGWGGGGCGVTERCAM